MDTTTAVPTTISPEAAARVAELGLQREFDQMVEFTRRMPGVTEVKVIWEDPHDTGCSEVLFTPPVRNEEERDKLRHQWLDWAVETFPPHVFMYFSCFPELPTEDDR